MCYLVFTLLLLHKRRVYHETHVYFFESGLPAEHRPFMYSGTVYRLCFSAPMTADAASPALVILSRYHATLKIGDSFTLAGIASNGKWVRFKSSKSAVASVNTYGRVTAKKRAPARLREKSQVGKPVVKLPSQKLSLRYQLPPLQWKTERRLL